jgi:hypothetical protein
MNPYINNLLKEIIASNKNVKAFYLSEFKYNQNLQNEFKSPNLLKIINEALEIRKLGFSFWESLISRYNIIENCPDDFLAKAIHHNNPVDIIKFPSDNLAEIQNYIVNNYSKNISLLSTLELSNKNKLHIPMIDFHILPSKNNQKVAEKIIYVLNINPGYLIESGKSYHYIGINAVSENNLISILAKSILLSPIVDRNWSAHQILEKSCSIRVTKSEKKDLKLIKIIN